MISSFTAWLKLVAVTFIVLVAAVFYFGDASRRPSPVKPAPRMEPERVAPDDKRPVQVYVITSEGRRFLVFESWSGHIQVFMMDGWIAGEQM